MRLEFETSSDVSFNQRSVYTLLDFLGDVGGLFDMMILLAKLIWTVAYTISGSEINRYLIAMLFVRDKKKKAPNEQ